MGKRMITIPEYTCGRCGHVWLPKVPDRIPLMCASCNSPYWDRPRVYKAGHKVLAANIDAEDPGMPEGEPV